MDRFPLVAVLLGLVACDGGQSGENGFDPCEGVTWEDVDATDASLGFTASDVVAAIPRPVGVSWTQLHLEPSGERIGVVDGAEPPEDTLSLSGLASDGQVRVADLSAARPDCRFAELGERQLVFPLALEVSLGNGAVSAAGAVEVWAGGPDPARVSVNAGWDLPADLSGEYDVAFDAWWAAERASIPEATDWLLEGVFVTPFGTLDALELDIGALYESSMSSSASALWRGEAIYAD